MYNENQRIEITDTMQTAIIKIAEGNPGALTAAMTLCKVAQEVDPDSGFGPLGPLLSLDVEGIYGPNVWILFKDVCQHDPVRVLALFRVCQLGLRDLDLVGQLGSPTDYLTNPTKINALRDFARDEAVDLVRGELPDFAKGWTKPEAD